MLAGPVTVLEDSTYAGDASINNVPPGQERLISYGIDMEVVADATQDTSEGTIESGRIIRGTFTVSRKQVVSQKYLFENKGDKDKTLIIEHPLRPGWHLVNTPKPLETTPQLYRFQTRIPAKSTTTFIVCEEVINSQTTMIVSLGVSQAAFYQENGKIGQGVKDVLAKAISLNGLVAATQRQINERNERLKQITAEQARIRQNVNTAAANSTYSTRLLAKLNDQETLIEKLQEEVDQLTQTLEKQRGELDAYLENANVE